MRVRRVGGRPVGPATLSLVAAGAVAIGVGAGFIVASAVGVTSWDVLTTAVADRAGVTVGVAGALASVAVYVACAPFGRLPGWGNLVLLFGVSGAVDVTLAVVDEPSAMAARIALYVVGVPLVCLGVAFIVHADIGVGPLEMVMLVATDRGVPLVRARVVIEVVTLAVGGALGGDLGVGTAVFAVAAGPLIAGWLHLLRWRGSGPPSTRSAGAEPSGPVASGRAGPEELERVDRDVPQDGEQPEHHGTRGERPPRRA